LVVSTISIALDIFWASVNDGLQGAIITHDEASLNDFRAKVDRYLGSLPKELTRGTVKSNRSRLEFSNGSVLNYMVAGTRKGGTLGRAFGLNFVHATECTSWADEELRDSFSLKTLDIRSAEMLDEMRKVTIGAEGRQRDDRVMASALAHVAWTDWIRKKLITEGRTFEREQERMRLAAVGKGEITLQQKLLEDFIRDKRRERNAPAAKWYDNIRPVA